MAIYDAGASNLNTKTSHGIPEGEMDALLLGITRELVASTPSQRNYKGILIALLVICAICGLILFAIYLLRPPDDGPRVKGRKVTLSDTISKHFVVQPFNGTWITDHEILFRDSRGGISIFNTATLDSRQFLSNTIFRQLNANKFSVSPDEQFVLFIHDVKRVWEHSSLAKYTLYDIENVFKIELNTYEVKKNREVEQTQLQYAEWGPKGNSIIMIYKNDIYYKSSINLNNTRAIQITNTGQMGVIFNGVPDWIYEVTVLKSNKALWISPNGKFLVFASFNDTLVGEVSYPWYGQTLAYPQLRRIRYPKAGTTNPEVTIWAVNLESNDVLRPILIKTPLVIDPRNYYLVNVQWIDDQDISVIWENRQQNTAIFSICSSTDWICKMIYTVNPPEIGWLDFPHTPIFSTSKEKCLLRLPIRDGEIGYFHHIFWLDIKTGKAVPITNGHFEVTQISAWDQFNQFIYFIGVPSTKLGERHLYRIKGISSNQTPICLTCPSSRVKNPINELTGQHFGINSQMEYKFPASILSENSTISFKNENLDESEPCLYNEASFSPTHHLFVRECLGPGVPIVTLHQAPSGQLVYILNPNSAMKQEVLNLGLPLVKTFQVEVSGGYLAPARLYLPAGFREGEEFKFPLVLHVSGTPGTQLVSEKWRLSWASYLTSQKNFIVAEIDGRGTGYLGENIRNAVHENFGGLQASDQLEFIKYLKDNLSFIDERNVAIWGSGYGGYLTLLTLAQDTSNLFKCGISVAPITKWEFYNSVYTERYFGMPNLTENTGGYEEGDVVRIIKYLRGKKLLLIHGTADEKVHDQHTLHLTKALIKEGIHFTEQVYPDEGHEFLGVLEHLHNTMESFLDLHFELPDWEDWEKANFLGIRM